MVYWIYCFHALSRVVVVKVDGDVVGRLELFLVEMRLWRRYLGHNEVINHPTISVW